MNRLWFFIVSMGFIYYLMSPGWFPVSFVDYLQINGITLWLGRSLLSATASIERVIALGVGRE